MQFLTDDECKQWLARRWQPDFERSKRRAYIAYSAVPSRLHYISRWIASELTTDDAPVLLWVTSTFASQSNWHLYYRVPQSYGDRRLIEAVPGHLCLSYETEDLATLIYLTMLNHWDASLIPEERHSALTFSHHGFIDVFSDDDQFVEDVQKNASDKPAGTE